MFSGLDHLVPWMGIPSTSLVKEPLSCPQPPPFPPVMDVAAAEENPGPDLTGEELLLLALWSDFVVTM